MATQERGWFCETVCVCLCKKDVENMKCFQHCLLSLQLCALCILFGRFCDLATDGEGLRVSQQAFLLIG